MNRLHRRARRCARCAAALVLVAGLGMPTARAATELGEIEVVGTTPLPGIGLGRNEIPAPVQSATGEEIRRGNALNLADFLNRHFGGVHLNDMQGNPFQPDLNYRGYTASPLLGTPQGLSVYLDGVRLNQPFGDIVSWDLVPKSAIASMTLMPGSNPLFGLNTLGGALSVQTKDGRSHPGARLGALVGRHGRHEAEFEYGRQFGHFDAFVTGSLFREDGWRDDSPSRVGQLFGKLSWRSTTTTLHLSLAHADTDLTGNGLQEQNLLAGERASVYTKPDITRNQSSLLNLTAQRSLDDTTVVSGNVYYRQIRSSTLNGDLNDDALDQSVYQPNAAERAALTAAGYSGFPLAGANATNTPFPFWRCIANVLLRDEPAEKCNGLINRSQTQQSQYGLTGQLTRFGRIGASTSQLTLGAAIDASRARFRQSTQLGYLNPDRSVTGLEAFGDGVTGGDVDGAPYDTRVDLNGRTRTWSAYATQTVSFADVAHLTVSGRFNRTSVRNRDAITPGAGAGSLDGDHVFRRLNPAVGITLVPVRTIAAYVGYSEGSRAPTSIELGCADPAQPCRLPNSMAGDPPLRQVVTKTWESGLHGGTAALRWSASLFRGDSQDDILFVAAPNQTQFGYFRNFGKTRRQGVELGLSGRSGPLGFSVHYNYLDATYRSEEIVNGSSHSGNDEAAGGEPGVDGNIAIRAGNRIPLVPRHIFKASLDYRGWPGVGLGASMIAVGGSYARGNENNQHAPDGVFYLGPGRSGGYALLNLGADYRPQRALTTFAQINNVFDRRYATAALLGPTGFNADASFVARPFPANAGGEFPLRHATFFAPGAPRTFWIGVRYEIDAVATPIPAR